jgi:tRNA threonylcarbamoyladenosine biosynthesis protein TsaB
MLLLAIETSTLSGGVALIGEEGIIAEYRLNIEITHSERLLVMIDRVLQEARIPLSKVDALAVSIGPGSFTGLRIGLATAEGLALGAAKPIVTVPTLMALACRVPFSTLPVVPLLDAKKKEVYWAAFQFDGEICRRLIDDEVSSPEEMLRRIPRPALFLGEGARLYADLIRKEMGDQSRFAPAALLLPSAASVAEIGLEKLRRGELSDPISATPLYLRRSEAEIKWENR